MYRPRYNIKYTNISLFHKMHFAAFDISISAQDALCCIWPLSISAQDALCCIWPLNQCSRCTLLHLTSQLVLKVHFIAFDFSISAEDAHFSILLLNTKKPIKSFLEVHVSNIDIIHN
jgi:hypothetical protein